MNNREHFTRVPNDPRRPQRGPSKQIATLWPPSQFTSKETLKLIELIKPNGLCIHDNGIGLAVHGEEVVKVLRSHFDVEISCAIAGDYDKPNIPGFADGWKEAAQMAEANKLTFIQPNCEIAQLHRPPGTAHTGLTLLREGAPTTEIRHTTYGAIDNVDGDLEKDGHQSFGGHHGGELNEYTRVLGPDCKPIVSVTVAQWYWGAAKGEFRASRSYGMRTQDAYCRSSASTVGTGRNDEVHPDIKIYPYLQAWGCRPDELAHLSEYFPETQWWALKSRSTSAGWITIACLSELYRRNLSIRDFQRSAGLDPDGWLGPKTYKALLPAAPWKHPQSA